MALKGKEIKKDSGLIDAYLDFEKKMISNPRTCFSMLGAGIEWRSNIIWKEFIDWQKEGGKIRNFEIREKKKNDYECWLFWEIEKEIFGQAITIEIDKEPYKAGIRAVYSFMMDRPQYCKFRKLEGMFNPLRLLLCNFIKLV